MNPNGVMGCIYAHMLFIRKRRITKEPYVLKLIHCHFYDQCISLAKIWYTLPEKKVQIRCVLVSEICFHTVKKAVVLDVCSFHM
jgi:hypothetical protein